MGYILATGFENRDSTFASVTGGGFSTSNYHSGGGLASLVVSSSQDVHKYGSVPFVSAVSELWASIWFYYETPQGNSQSHVGFANNNYINLVSPLTIVSGSTWQSAVSASANAWHHLFIHLKVAAAPNGVFEFRLDGGALQTFTGNTRPGSATVSEIWMHCYNGSVLNGSQSVYIDDVTVKDDTWPQALNYRIKYPTGNDSVEWTPSAGNNWQCVDEYGPNDADYVSSTANADVDLYTCNSISLDANEVPKVVIQYIRAKKETPDAGAVKMILDVQGTQDESAQIDQGTTFASFRRILPQAPGSVDWDATNINQIKIGQESVM